MPIRDGKFYYKPALAVLPWHFIFLCYFNYLSDTQCVNFNFSDLKKIVHRL